MSQHIFDTATAASFSEQKMKKVNLYQSHRMFCDVYCLLPGQSQRTHVHNDEDKVYYALTGTCDVQIGDDVTPLSPGHGAVAPAGVVHGVTNKSQDRATLLVFMAPHPKPPAAG